MITKTSRESFETPQFALTIVSGEERTAYFQLITTRDFDAEGPVEDVLNHVAALRDQLTGILNATGDRR